MQTVKYLLDLCFQPKIAWYTVLGTDILVHFGMIQESIIDGEGDPVLVAIDTSSQYY